MAPVKVDSYAINTEKTTPKTKRFYAILLFLLGQAR